MGDHDLRKPDPEPEPDTAPVPIPATAPAGKPVAKVIEVKVVAASVVTLGASVLYAALNAVSEHPLVILAGWPAWAQTLAVAVVPPLATFAAGYAQPSNRVPRA